MSRRYQHIILKKNYCAVIVLKPRKHGYGTENIVGKNIELLRKERRITQKEFVAKLQVAGLDINPTSYSKLEGQVRGASDIEIYTIAKVLNISIEDLFKNIR